MGKWIPVFFLFLAVGLTNQPMAGVVIDQFTNIVNSNTLSSPTPTLPPEAATVTPTTPLPSLTPTVTP